MLGPIDVLSPGLFLYIVKVSSCPMATGPALTHLPRLDTWRPLESLRPISQRWTLSYLRSQSLSDLPKSCYIIAQAAYHPRALASQKLGLGMLLTTFCSYSCKWTLGTPCLVALCLTFVHSANHTCNCHTQRPSLFIAQKCKENG